MSEEVENHPTRKGGNEKLDESDSKHGVSFG
jgi:hypothetical protein